MKQKIKQIDDIEQRNKWARAWLSSHKLINIAALCRAIDYDRGNFWGFEMNTRDLPEDVLKKLERQLINYGYVQPI